MNLFTRTLWVTCSFASFMSTTHGQFGTAVVIDTAADEPRLQAVDIDGDGDLDLAGKYADGYFKWRENLDGAGDLAAPVAMLLTGGPTLNTMFGDLDGDLDSDIIWYFLNDSTVRVSKNEDGVFTAATIVADLDEYSFGTMELINVAVGTQPDIALTIGAGGMSRLALIHNIDGVFGSIELLPEWFEGQAPSICLTGDIDNAEGKDMLVFNSNGLAMVALNTNGDGSLWTLDTLFQIFSYPFTDPQLIDVDGDGDLDIAEAANSVVQWAENVIDADPPQSSFIVHELEPFTTAGAGYFGHVGCGPGATVIYVPTNPQLPVHWNTYLPETHSFTTSVELEGVARCTRTILADVTGDGRQDIICMNDDGLIIYPSVVEPPTTIVEMPVFETFCKSGPPVPLPQAIPADGLWSGPWVINGTFFRSSVGFQTNIVIAYTVHEPQGCPVAGVANMNVVTAPIISPVLGSVICLGDGPIQMNSVPANTVWEGLEEGNILDPETYNGDVINCVYQDPTGMVCGAIVGPFNVWNSVNAELIPAGPFCITDGVQEILPAVNLPNNNWSGDITIDMNSAFFDPSQGAGVYTVVLQRNASQPEQCAASDTLTISVSDDIPQIDIAAMPPYCASQLVELSGATPAGGNWSGTGVSDGQLDPTVVGAGTHSVTYSYTAPEGCSNAVDVDVEFIGEINVEFNADDLQFCPVDEAVQFTALPAGGDWVGDVTPNGVFDPFFFTEGTYALHYVWTDANGCSVESGIAIPEILPTTEISITPVGVLCLSQGVIDLQGSLDGTWSGSVTGTGMTIPFDPAMLGTGSWPVTLSGQEGSLCPGETSINVVVDPCTGIEEVTATNTISIAPNPFVGTTIITLSGSGHALVEIRDATGRLVQNASVVVNGTTTLPLDLNSEANGTYFVSVTVNGPVSYLKAVKAE